MWYGNRRDFHSVVGGVALGALTTSSTPLVAQEAREAGDDIEIVYPRNRIPLSFIIDDSTCLVNMAHFALPQFAEAWPDRAVYKKDWRSWPREIPDSFVREFGEWCGEHGVKGKYSIVPNPACVGWLDRELPGWSRKELQASLKLVRELMLPNWDIHPEMITHTRVIDLKTGRPLKEISPATMENSYPRTKKSVDELTAYLSYALRILKNCDLPCEGITTPGGFGSLVKSELSLASMQAVRDVYQTEIPHYFKYVISGDESTEPKLEHVSKRADGTYDLSVNIPAGTGDWFGSWEGDRQSEGFRYVNEDVTGGRMVELIERGQPALMLCHWPGMYCNGSKEGFHDFQKIVVALNKKYGDVTQWMKLTEIARYWATKELASVRRTKQGVLIESPFDCPQLTLRLPIRTAGELILKSGADAKELKKVNQLSQLNSGTWFGNDEATLICLDVAKGTSLLATT